MTEILCRLCILLFGFAKPIVLHSCVYGQVMISADSLEYVYFSNCLSPLLSSKGLWPKSELLSCEKLNVSFFVISASFLVSRREI